MPAAATKHLYTVDDYYHMAEAGAFIENNNVELIEGEIIDMVPMGCYHAWCITVLTRFFNKHIPDKNPIHVQTPLRIDNHTELEPDVFILKPSSDDYKNHHPVPEDVLLLIEVSQSTIQFDTNVKSPIYAKSGIPELWLIDLEAEQVLRYLYPVKGKFTQQEIFVVGESLSPSAFPEVLLTVNDILGKDIV